MEEKAVADRFEGDKAVLLVGDRENQLVVDRAQLPPGTREASSGLTVFFMPEFSVLEPIANSSRIVLPTITASAASSFSTAVAL
jgi:hypothetical protein